MTKKKATNLKRKNPTRFSLDQEKQIVDLHHKKLSNLCHFTECYCLLWAYVCVLLFAFSCYAGLLGLSAQIGWFCFRILVFLQCSVFCLYIYVLPAGMGSQIRPKQTVRQFAPSLTKKKATNLKRKNPTRFSLDQKKHIIDLHH